MVRSVCAYRNAASHYRTPQRRDGQGARRRGDQEKHVRNRDRAGRRQRRSIRASCPGRFRKIRATGEGAEDQSRIVRLAVDGFHKLPYCEWRRTLMFRQRSICALALGASLLVGALAGSTGAVTAAEEAKYPDLRGRWDGVLRTKPGLPGQPSFDAGKAWGKGQEAPLTAEYQAVLETNLKSQAEGGAGDWLGADCKGF